MTRALASLASLALVAALAATGALACPCGAGPTAGEGPSACHDAESGLSAAPMSCGCACVGAAPAPSTVPRIEPVVAAAASLHQTAPVTIVSGSQLPAAIVANTASPPAPPRHQILRI